MTAASSTAKMIEEESYDAVPYESYVYTLTHPNRLATIASLFGMKPAAMENARVLELGCAGGGNLLPLALAYPKGTYFGIDLSGKQIEEANTHKAALGLTNITFKQRDITKLEHDIGTFDYIICHGVFSWVPDFVREAIFDVCRRHLSPQGLAVISYNVLPGWSAVKALREMMVFHTSRFEKPAEKIHEARALLNFLYNNVPDSNRAYKDVIDNERKLLSSTNDSYIFHEHLESENNQFYLHQFVDAARKHALDYLGDATLTTMYLGNLPQDAQQQLAAITDIVQQEQYMDFITNRRFRYSVLMRKECGSLINRNIQGEKIFDYYCEPLFAPAPVIEPQITKGVKFENDATKQSFTVNHDGLAEALRLLCAAGVPSKLRPICQQAAQNLGVKTTAASIEAEFVKSGFILVLQGLMNLHTEKLSFATALSKKPKAYTLAAYQASLPNVMKVCNLKRSTITIDAYSKKLLVAMDGTRDKDALLAESLSWVASGDITLNQDGKPLTDKEQIEKIMAQQLDAMLTKLLELALIEA